MKNVMFVIGFLSNGGAERVISILAKELIKQGHNVSIVTVYGDRNDYLKDENVKIFPIIQKYRNRFVRALEIVRQTRQLIREQKPDLIISFDAMINIYSIFARSFLKNTLIISERNDPNQYPQNKNIRKFRDILYHFCDGIVFQTNDAKEYFSLSIKRKGAVIPNPIISNLPEWKQNDTEKNIITACRLTKQKNLPLLIDAFCEIQEEFPNYKLKIYGEGELRPFLGEYIKEKRLDGKILMPGFSNDIHLEMANSSLFVISSNYEGISNSMLEALAIGIPVISTDSPIGGAKMFIKNEINGVLVQVGNKKELKTAMRKVLSDPNYAGNLSSESKKVKDELTPEKISKKWIEFANNTIKDSHV